MTTHLPARSRRALATLPRGVTLAMGQEWWVDNRHALAGRLQSDRTVRELARYDLGYGLHGVLVERLRPRPSRARRTAVWALVAFLGLSAIGMALWVLLEVFVPLLAALAPVLAVLAGIYCLIKILSGHRVTCPGLHCPGCRH
jgi:hypothetical protein